MLSTSGLAARVPALGRSPPPAHLRTPAETGHPAQAPTPSRTQALGRAAVAALYDELALHPKPGLVSFVDSGSHGDMDAGTFLRSLFALRHAFVQLARLGQQGAPWPALEAAGITAEARMLRATGGINTHRGALFTLGCLCAAAGSLPARPTPADVRAALLRHWGDALAERRHRSRDSNGRRAAQRHALRGAGEEAALGFPTLFDTAVPALRQARAAGLDSPAARLQTLFTVMATLDDTNLVHRGGLAGLRHAQAQAARFLAEGGAARPDAQAHALRLHADFMARRLSPGGAADLLAAACWIERVCR